MLILVGLLFLLTIGLAVYALLPSKKQEPEDIDKKVIRPATAILEPLNPAADKIEELNQQKKNLQVEFEQLKKENADLKVESLNRMKETEEMRKQLAELKSRPQVNEEQSRKADGLAKENSDLANKIKLLEVQIESYKKESAQTLGAGDKVKALETQVEDYKKEIAKLNEALAQKPQVATPPAAAGETVSKEEYEELKKKLEAAESVLKIVHGEMDSQS